VDTQELYRLICQEDVVPVPVFAQAWWLDAVCDGASGWQLALAKRGEQIVGAWPYCVQHRLGISILRNPRLSPYLGPLVFFPPDLKERYQDAYEQEVTEQLLGSLPKALVWRLSLWPGYKQLGLFMQREFGIGVRQTFLLGLQQTEAAIFSGFKEATRRNIRVAQGKMTVAEEPDALDALLQFQAYLLEGKGLHQTFSLAQAQSLLAACLRENAGALWVARAEGQIQAIVWNVWDRQTRYYFMGAMNPEGDSSKAMSLLLWHCIQEAKKRGNHTFDFEGSMDPGVERFFRNFGGARTLYLVLQKEKHWLWRLSKALGIRK